MTKATKHINGLHEGQILHYPSALSIVSQKSDSAFSFQCFLVSYVIKKKKKKKKKEKKKRKNKKQPRFFFYNENQYLQ